jgi:hypothetical protein
VSVNENGYTNSFAGLGTYRATGTWRFTGLPVNTVYNVCAFVPGNYGNNPNTQYSVSSNLATIFPDPRPGDTHGAGRR